jgi:hypothetical protein
MKNEFQLSRILERGSVSRSTSELTAGTGSFEGHPTCAPAAAHRAALLLVAMLLLPLSLVAQPRRSLSSPSPAANYSSNLVIIVEAQQQALEQAREMLEEIESERERGSLQAAIKEMERSQAALEAAEKSPEKLPAAIAAQQNAYQALLKLTPREYRMTRGQQNAGQSGQSGQPQRQQMEQLEMSREENRYETERQARAEPNPQQREQLQTADRLKELAHRQQDLNERLRELQTALQAARTGTEREELQRQLKRLRDEQRQMLADVDQLRQQMEQSSNATPEAREQMEQARSDMQRAAEAMENQSPSGALAAGARAQQNMQDLREDLRRQTSSQFSEQMRELRNEARELSRQQEEIARGLDSLENGPQRSLDTARERKEIVQQMTRQQTALTNLLADMRAVTEQSESTEPLLSSQLYDTLRRADQAQTENMMRIGAQLTDRGFLPQASEAERAVRRNIDDLRQSVERAAESVLGDEAESLRYADRELEDLTRQVERELAGAATNSPSAGTQGRSGRNPGDTNQMAAASGRAGPGNQESQQPGQSGGSESEQGAASGQQGSGEEPSENAQAQAGGGRQQGAGQGEQQARTGQAGNPGQRGSGEGTSGESDSETPPEGGTQTASTSQRAGGRNDGGGGGGGGDRLREIAEQLGSNNGGNWAGGPITGGGFVDWSDRLRDVERVLDQADLRNELAAARERLAALRTDYREYGRSPSEEVLKQNIVAPLTQVRVWLQQQLARQENPQGLVPLDRDPVPENFSELVRKYYENLGSAQ